VFEGIEKLAAMAIVFAPAYVIFAYVWSRTSQTVTRHQLLIGVSAGVGSIFIDIILGISAWFFAFATRQEPLISALILALPGSGMNEEIAKALICSHLIFNSKKFKEPGEILILCVLIGFGFALYENIGYLSLSKDIIGVAYLRALTATMMHMSLAVLMGVAAIHASRTHKFVPFVAVVAGQILLHGAYNFPLLYANALSKAGSSFPPQLLLANGVVLIACVVLAIIALNMTDLHAETNPNRTNYNLAIFFGGFILVIISFVTAAMLKVRPLEDELLGASPLYSYLALCGPPFILGLEMIFNILRAPSSNKTRPVIAMHQSTTLRPLRTGDAQESFGRRRTYPGA